MNSTQDVLTRKSEYRLAAVGILAVIVAIATIVQMNAIIDDIDRIAERQREQQDALLKSLREHNAIENQ
jgi:hypothetical protein